MSLVHEGVSARTCRVCSRPHPIEAFKLYRQRCALVDGTVRIYTRRDTTCRRCRWDAVKDRVNARRRKVRGGAQIGSANSQAILTEDWVTFIRSRTGRAIPVKVLARWSGVDASTISLARNDRTWNKVSRRTG